MQVPLSVHYEYIGRGGCSDGKATENASSFSVHSSCQESSVLVVAPELVEY